VIDLRRYRHLVLTVYLLLLLVATLTPVPKTNLAPSGFDKIAHVGLFGGLALLIFWYETQQSWAGAMRAFGLATAAALLVELLQALVPFRDADFADLVAGAAGAAVGVAAAALLHSGRAGRQASPGP
jgi:VanZ family protein